MKDQKAREDIQNFNSQLIHLHGIIQNLEERLNAKIEAVYTHNRVVDLQKENAALKEKLNAKNK